MLEWLLVISLTLGPVLGLTLFLNARDRRRAALLEAAWSLAPRGIRPLIAIEARPGPPWRRGVVEVDMRDCSRDEIWDAVARWSAGLPPGVRLVVAGGLARAAASITVRRPSRRPVGEPLAAG
jgi:hypothetical protein